MKNKSTPFSRVNRSLDEAESYYSRLSSFYDLLAHSEKKFIKRGIDLLNPRQSDRILEIGSGTGYAQIYINRKLDSGLCIGLDLSAGMCLTAHRNLSRSGLSHSINIIRSDSMPTPFQAGSFDAVFISFTLELFDTPQIPIVLREFSRVLKPGGKLVVVALSKDQPLPWAGKLYENLHVRFPRVLDCRPIPVRDLVEKDDFEIIEDRLWMMWGLPVIILLAKRK
jgi:demethylmenaquinone methyltransferase/2-methoxy-6-polyprenyl-1,4-benzoquinol methylase